MPSINPKHKKKITQSKEMGLKNSKDICCLKECKSEGTHHLAISNVDGYLKELKWDLEIDKRKSRRISLCKKHYKDYKKLKNKEEKFTKFRDFGPKKMPKREKSHNFLE